MNNGTDNRGSILVFGAIAMTMFLSFVALTIDVGFGVVTKGELHNVADAGALAGARQLGRIYECLPNPPNCAPPFNPSYQAQQTYVLSAGDRALVQNAVTSVAALNKAGSVPIQIAAADIHIGQWNPATKTLAATTAQPHAVQVTARRDGTSNGPINTFFAGIMGAQFRTLNVANQATAALTAVSQVLPGELDAPIGISKAWFTTRGCGNDIQFNPTGLASCAGWNTFTVSPASANNLNNILDGLANNPPTVQSPGVTAGVTGFSFIGGTLGTPTFNRFLALYNERKDPGTGEWKTFVVVYDRDDCSNPNQTIKIIGFATAIITNVEGPPNKIVRGRLECNLVETGRGGGAQYGTLGSLPGLVQ